MGAPYQDPETKLAEALIAVESDAGLENLATLYGGSDFEEHECPYVVNAVPTGTRYGDPSGGNWKLTAEVTAWSSADVTGAPTTTPDPWETHGTLVGSLRDCLLVGNLKDLLSQAVDDFAVIGVVVGEISRGQAGRKFWSKITLEVWCAMNDL